MEISHRSKEFIQVADESEQDLRDLLNIPDNYKVLSVRGRSCSIRCCSLQPWWRDERTYIDAGYWLKVQWLKQVSTVKSTYSMPRHQLMVKRLLLFQLKIGKSTLKRHDVHFVQMKPSMASKSVSFLKPISLLLPICHLTSYLARLMSLSTVLSTRRSKEHWSCWYLHCYRTMTYQNLANDVLPSILNYKVLKEKD